MSNAAGPRRDSDRQQGIAAAIAEVSERATLLVREEIELAKTEIAEKTTRLAKGAIVGIVAGVFFFTALFFVLIGLAWLLYFELPIGNQFTYFWGFFAMALILVVLGVIAGILAARAVKSGAPPTPEMAIAEARKIRETVSSSSGNGGARPVGPAAGGQGAPPPVPLPPPVPTPAPSTPASWTPAPLTAPASTPPASTPPASESPESTAPALGSAAPQPPASGPGDSASAITQDFAVGEEQAGPGGATHDSDLGRGIGNGPTLGR